MSVIPQDRLERLVGWGGAVESVGYVFRPTTADGIKEVFHLAKESGRKVTLRGAGRSYGDASIGAESIVLEITRMNRILSWDPATGIITCEPGVTIEQLWKHCIPDGWWPPVVSGTMYPTLAGCLGMNIHGKNNYHAGPIGDHVIAFEFISPDGELHKVTKEDDLFYSVISSFGMLGSFTSISLQMKKVYSGLLDINVLVAGDLHELFTIYDKHIEGSDYLVGWIDAFASGKQLGRAVVHQANYLKEGEDSRVAQTLRVENQMLPDMILGFFPKSAMWIIMKPFVNNAGMKLTNWSKMFSSKIPFLPKSYKQSHAAFAFLLDYVPGWKKSYGKGGLIQYQSFIPKETAEEVYRKQFELCQTEKLVPYLAVFKRHRPDKFLISHAVDGYSLALDFKVTKKNKERLWKLCHKMNDIVLAGGGRFYFAKDATLRQEDLSYLGEETIAKLKKLKSSLDPDGILETDLSKRLFSKV
jgi:decaprenylphospho-beta-D-ribofuranose 2-oxidase